MNFARQDDPKPPSPLRELPPALRVEPGDELPYAIAPQIEATGERTDARLTGNAQPATPAPATRIQRPERQISLASVLALLTVAAVLSAVVGGRPSPAAAWWLGVASLAMLGLAGMLGRKSLAIRAAWWLIFAAYLLASVLTLLPR